MLSHRTQASSCKIMGTRTPCCFDFIICLSNWRYSCSDSAGKPCQTRSEPAQISIFDIPAGLASRRSLTAFKLLNMCMVYGEALSKPCKNGEKLHKFFQTGVEPVMSGCKRRHLHLQPNGHRRHRKTKRQTWAGSLSERYPKLELNTQKQLTISREKKV